MYVTLFAQTDLFCRDAMLASQGGRFEAMPIETRCLASLRFSS
ncbi:MAG: hypothetical protein VSS75_020640 [Candidatus Parabeggiatoa sp.]|nr:hypothetical protein [Candidatus Parabeggiatoa sp.]